MNSTHWLNEIMNTMYVNSDKEFWIGLSSTEPDKDGGNITEPTGDDYARVQVTGFTPANDGFIYNVEQIAFQKSQSIWFPPEAKAAYWLLFDGPGADANFLQAGQLQEPKTIESSTTLAIAAETMGIALFDCEHAIA